MDVKKKMKSLSRVRLFATPWTVAYRAPPSALEADTFPSQLPEKSLVLPMCLIYNSAGRRWWREAKFSCFRHWFTLQEVTVPSSLWLMVSVSQHSSLNKHIIWVSTLQQIILLRTATKTCTCSTVCLTQLLWYIFSGRAVPPSLPNHNDKEAHKCSS